MSLITCPTDVVAAPAERIWALLVDPVALADWTGVTLRSGPGRTIQPGDQLRFSELGLTMTFAVLGVERPRAFTVDVTLPFGIVNHEVIQLSPVDAGRCRVTFNWDFRFPPGWRGRWIQRVLGRRFINGPAESLARLKHTAEGGSR